MMGPGTTLLRQEALAQARTPVDVFDNLYLVFLVLGTIVGVIVISYTVYNAYKYRTDSPDEEGGYDVDEAAFDDAEDDVARPQVGEVPTGAGKGGGKKLFISFSISAIVVLGLIVYGYSLFLYVEDTDQLYEGDQEPLEIQVTGQQFFWEYTYPDGTTMEELRVPTDRPVMVNVTSEDVMHNFGIRELRVKADAIPNQYNTAWFEAEETGIHEAICYELCGAGHSTMRGEEVIVMEPAEFQNWYNNGSQATAEVSSP